MRTQPGRLAALLATLVLVTACGSSPASSGGQHESVKPTASAAPVIPTSEKLIAEALGSGSITYEQSLEYRALALYDSPGLPSEFRSPIANMDAAGDLLGEIDAKEKTLSPGLLAKLAPYRARPNDPISIFNTQPAAPVSLTGAALGVVGGAPFGGIVPAADDTPIWKSRPAAGGKALVWVKDSPAAEMNLDDFAEMTSKVWASYAEFFTYPLADTPNIPSKAVNPDAAIDIYFIRVGELDPRRAACLEDPSDPKCALPAGTGGYALRVLPIAGNTSSGALVLDMGREDDKIMDHIAHELAHAGQFAYDRDESSWLMESTATWVAFKVDKDLKKKPTYQYDWLPQFFSGADKTLTRLDNDNQYASWLYFLFASMEKGDGVVTDIWKAAAANGEQGYKAADQVFPFADHFDEFAVRDWNEEPVDPQYKSVDETFPQAPQPDIENSPQTLEAGEKDTLEVALPPLASAYYRYDFPDTVRDVTFENGLIDDPDAHVWAMKKIGGEWKPPEDWTASAERKFCLDVPEEDVERLVLVISNNSTADALNVAPSRITAGTKGCSGWSGTMTASGVWGGAGARSHGAGTATFTGIWMIDETWEDPNCDRESGEACAVLYRPTGSITWTWDSQVFDTLGKLKCEISTSGALAAGQEHHEGATAQALFFRQFDKDHLQFWGTGGFNGPQLKCPNTINDGTIPGMFFAIDERASTANGPDATGGTCWNSNWQLEIKAKTLSGSCWSYNYPNNREKFEWNLTWIGPAPGN